jgi:gamma-glutamyltranspeptidase/glutathione hydrolase
MVSATLTVNLAFGASFMVPGTGFVLNNEMDDFSAKPGSPNMFGLVGAEANAIEPEKRMLSSMTPTIVEDPDGDLLLVTGTPGGSTIITTVFQTILNVVDHGMSVQQAVDAPRVHHQWLPDVLFFERRGLSPDTQHHLRLRGWSLVERRGASGRADLIAVRCQPTSDALTDPSGLDALATEEPQEECALFGAADPRGEDAAVGY